MTAFSDQVNDDLNTTRGLAVAWDLAKSALTNADKKATLLRFDEVLGLGLGDWRPAGVPEDVMVLVAQRDAARAARQWGEADRLRDAIAEAGYEVRDTPEGAVVRKLI